jgi:hypothetical protein
MRNLIFVIALLGCGGDSANKQCSGLLSVCAAGSDFCCGVCTPTTAGSVCSCLVAHVPCSDSAQCCAGLCQSGVCACSDRGAACGSDSECCSGSCNNGVCDSPPDMAQPPDLAKLPPCDPVLQTNCPSAEACFVDGTTPTCHAPGGTHTSGACTYNNECVGGDECYGNAQKSCHQFCNDDSGCRVTPGNQLPVSPANVAYCSRTLNGTALQLCTIPCNPVSALGGSGCGAGKCDAISFNAGTAEYTDCITLGSGAEGANCTYDDECGEGLSCFSSNGGQSHCRHMCRKGNDGDCVSGATCQTLTGWTQFGVCCPSAGC